MEDNDSKYWVAQPNVCRCCLSTSGTCEMSSYCDTSSGIKEVYLEMLQECYNITLSSEWSFYQLICNTCIEKLKIASSFRRQVLQCEEEFAQFHSNKTDDVIKIENEEHEEENVFKEMDDKLREYVECYETRSPKKKSKISKLNCDPDLSLQHLTEDNEINNKDNNVNICANPKTPPAKQLSERKRILLTCETVLKETNACPFRHTKSWFRCFFCTDAFMTMNSLRTHYKELHPQVDEELSEMKRYPRSLQIDITDLKCLPCDVTLKDVAAMRVHFETVHNMMIYTQFIADFKLNCSPYKCHICEQEFHVFRTLTSHINEHYANWICDVCGRSFINSKRLVVHKRTHENGQYPCTECGKVLTTKIAHANHMESAHSKRILKCQICFLPMKHYNDRIKHMSEVHDITHKFKCNICGKEYKIKHYLATHIRQTHGNKDKKCLECGMAFITNHGLKKHMTKHTGVKPHECNVCGKTYARSYTLKEHMRAHYVAQQQ